MRCLFEKSKSLNKTAHKFGSNMAAGEISNNLVFLMFWFFHPLIAWIRMKNGKSLLGSPRFTLKFHCSREVPCWGKNFQFSSNCAMD
jgi:hypothetical protein